jgi:4-hydroxyphenylpyruvate dioxygenase
LHIRSVYDDISEQIGYLSGSVLTWAARVPYPSRMTTLSQSPTATARPTVADQILGWDHLEWWVGNARAVTAWLCGGFGFEVAAYCGPETGQPDQVSYLLRQGGIRFVVTAGLSPESEVSRHVLVHGDGVRNLAWSVTDPAMALETAQKGGARVVAEPSTVEGEDGSVTTAAIAT